MQDNGLVVSSQNTLAEVEVQCFAACLNCSAKSLCLGQGQSKGRISAKNPLQAMPGDTVSLEIPETMYNKSLSLIFGTFLLAALVGLAAGFFIAPVISSPSSTSGILGLFLGLLAAGFWLFRLFRKKNNDHLFPIITAIINKGGHDG